ncbi:MULTISPECIES: aminotransferase class I/II-fold pyridoxal phosphate-dependent enzyme [Microbacterium]|uniref:aminotransferase class I/II-fold pyridoxal phosphate-dependent enzyme n=1 Tax=Microbacterium TaxID=33882 RepID=UPI001E40B65F|nr:aminotransferase class I/II-fold pyridoxal phosphate-dependent enzyme [Microbacterium nymphoidis]MCD2496961.1 aminotransferase class I/II-fold pyridoxal phosphate-dependent enzyme [Microbacterium nymphoidis]
MRTIPGAWRRAARGAGLLSADGAPSPTIFAEMSALAVKTNAVNLGQGFPDTDGPGEVLDAAREAIARGVNQYPPGRGDADLRLAIAEHQQRFYGLAPDPGSEIIITAGATEALASVLLALLDGPDDEVVVFEPHYDSYAACVALAGARLRTVPLRWPDFRPDLEQLAAAVTDRTRVILVNDPHNPTGVAFDDQTRDEIVRLAERHDAIIVTDEVYEHLLFDGRAHHPIAARPGAAGRTLSISSGGKTFRTTGWKVGWVSGPADLIEAVLAVKQFLTFSGSAPFQPAIAVGLRLPDAYFDALAGDMQHTARILNDGLRSAGLQTHAPDGTYFTVADVSALGVGDAAAFCRALAVDGGVVGIPLTAFVTSGDAQWNSLVRFAACKRPSVVEDGMRRLSAYTTTL